MAGTPLPVHPDAAIFPMLSDDELADLAADIKAKGLIHPIVLGEWTDDGEVYEGIIDGRNRLRACEIAGVKPQFTRLNGEDPKAFIVSANLARRNLKKGQQAMALALIYPEPEKGGRGKRGKVSEFLGQFSLDRLGQARAVLRHSRALALAVLADRTPLDQALAEVRDAEDRDADIGARQAELQAQAPDLAALVDEERLTIVEAYSAFEKRKAEAAAAEANKRETLIRLSESAYRGATALASAEFLAELKERLSDENFCKSFSERLRIDPSTVGDIQKGAKALAAVLVRIAKGGKLNV